MILRTAKISDIDTICRIIDEAQAQMARLGIDQWQNGYPDRSSIEADILSGLGLVLCSEEGCEVIAYCAAIFGTEPTYARIDDGRWLTDENAQYVVVHRLAVADKFKRQGIATEFVRRVEALAIEQDCDSFRIDTHTDNRYMHALCARLGFTRCGTIYVSDGSPRVAYEKVLR
ncbi:MAG: GNAT family N-acetyltransferase [Alistipes sp.]|nr:GNAT family N-acetyltransferase [Alistipes sp.]